MILPAFLFRVDYVSNVVTGLEKDLSFFNLIVTPALRSTFKTCHKCLTYGSMLFKNITISFM